MCQTVAELEFLARSPKIQPERDHNLKEFQERSPNMVAILTKTTSMPVQQCPEPKQYGRCAESGALSNPGFATKTPVALLTIFLAFLLVSCNGEIHKAGATDPMSDSNTPKSDEAAASENAENAKTELATFGAGCFWCVEAVLEQLDGVIDVQSGYMGGAVHNPTYQQVTTGTTGHAEVVQVKFDPERLPFRKLVDYFWTLHDPTTLNRQGADQGTQYRSAVFYHSDEQKTSAEESKKAADVSGTFPNPIVTEITRASEFYVAEDYHQD